MKGSATASRVRNNQQKGNSNTINRDFLAASLARYFTHPFVGVICGDFFAPALLRRLRMPNCCRQVSSRLAKTGCASRLSADRPVTPIHVLPARGRIDRLTPRVAQGLRDQRRPGRRCHTPSRRVNAGCLLRGGFDVTAVRRPPATRHWF